MRGRWVIGDAQQVVANQGRLVKGDLFVQRGPDRGLELRSFALGGFFLVPGHLRAGAIVDLLGDRAVGAAPGVGVARAVGGHEAQLGLHLRIVEIAGGEDLAFGDLNTPEVPLGGEHHFEELMFDLGNGIEIGEEFLAHGFEDWEFVFGDGVDLPGEGEARAVVEAVMDGVEGDRFLVQGRGFDGTGAAANPLDDGKLFDQKSFEAGGGLIELAEGALRVQIQVAFWATPWRGFSASAVASRFQWDGTCFSPSVGSMAS